MTPAAPDLAALVGARLCHDLISPVGAIGNGLELLDLAGHGGSPELALISDSVATALAKLRFFRLAFGPADPQARMARDEGVQICAAMFQGRFTVVWAAEADLPRPLARIACLAILCAEKSLPMGGTLELSATGDREAEAPEEIVLRVEGRRTAPPAELWAHACGGTPVTGLRPEAVQFALLRQALAEWGSRLATRFDDASLEVRIIAAAPAVSPLPAVAARP